MAPDVKRETRKPIITDPKPDLQRGDRVVVIEEGIEPWGGIVNAIKPSKESGWWVEVDRDDMGVWSICVNNGTRVLRS